MSVVSDSSDIRLITFAVGSERFVFDIMTVRQILPYAGSTAVPRAPEFIEGVIVVRNEVIPVVDLRQRLFPKLPPLDDQPFTLLCDTSYGAIGLKVDQVQRIITIGTAEILPAPKLVRGLRGDLLFGIIKRDELLLLLLDIEGLLSAEEREELVRARLEDEDVAETDPTNRKAGRVGG